MMWQINIKYGNKYTINHVLNSNNTLLNMYYVSKQVVNL